MTIPAPPSGLKNDYYILRHGESTSNTQGINVTDPAVGGSQFGLTEAGRKGVSASLRSSPLSQARNVLIFSSPFRRAKETAQIAHDFLDTSKPIRYRAELRERFAGDFDGKPSSTFARIYELDRRSAETLPHGVEPTAAIASRWNELLASIERTYEGRTVLLVSHGDPLSVLRTWVSGGDLRQHHQEMPNRGELGRLNPS